MRLGTKRHDIGSLSFFSEGGGFRGGVGSDSSAVRVDGGGSGGVLARSVAVDGGRRGGWAGYAGSATGALVLGPEMDGPLVDATLAGACCGRRRTTVLTVTLLDEDADADAGGSPAPEPRDSTRFVLGGGGRTRVFSARWYFDASLRVC